MIRNLGVKDGRGPGYEPVVSVDMVKDSFRLETSMTRTRMEYKARQMAKVSIRFKRGNDYTDLIRGTFSLLLLLWTEDFSRHRHVPTNRQLESMLHLLSDICSGHSLILLLSQVWILRCLSH